MLKALVFGIVYLDYSPQLSQTTNAADTRISVIQHLIENSKYSIHDLSRMASQKKGELARFNMPFELGMDIGCRRFGEPHHREKCMFILDQENYRYQRSLSDLAGSDIGSHGNDPLRALKEIRNWIRKFDNRHIDSARKIWRMYIEFSGDLEQIALKNELDTDDLEEMPWDEYCYYIQEWLLFKRNPKKVMT